MTSFTNEFEYRKAIRVESGDLVDFMNDVFKYDEYGGFTITHCFQTEGYFTVAIARKSSYPFLENKLRDKWIKVKR